MRLIGRRSGARIGARLLFLLSIGAVAVAACSGAASPILSTVGAPVGEQPAPAASAASGGGAGNDSTGTGGKTGRSGEVALVDDAKIVRTGSLQLTVGNVDTALASARDTVRGLGGYIGASQQQRDDDRLVATITYRIPVARWEEALDALRRLGTVIGEQTQATEVTSQLVDLDARIRNLKASETALVGYAENAPKVSDLLEIQSRLTDTRGEIERLTAQQASLTDQVALATLTVTYGTEVVAVTQAAAKWDPAAEVDRASATLLGIAQGVISFLIVVAIVWLPVLVVLGVLGLIAVFVARRLGWGRSQPLPPALPPQPPINPTASTPEG